MDIRVRASGTLLNASFLKHSIDCTTRGFERVKTTT